jgi:hypothetical protein
MKKTKKRLKGKKSIEELYYEMVKTTQFLLSQKETLEQPHAFKFVDTVTTYGAYQKPI